MQLDLLKHKQNLTQKSLLFWKIPILLVILHRVFKQVNLLRIVATDDNGVNAALENTFYDTVGADVAKHFISYIQQGA